MWAFSGFRIAGIDRSMCEGWFRAWVRLGWRFNIREYKDWDIFGTGFEFPQNFAFDDFIVAVPVFDWSIYFTGSRLNLFNFFNSRIEASFIGQFAVALNSLPSTFTTRFEFETYFIKRILGTRFITTGWSYGDLLSEQALYDAAGLSFSTVAAPVSGEILERVFSPLQMVLNNWAVSLGLQDNELYGLQIAILCYEKTQSEDYNQFYGYLQRFFIIWGYSANFISNFNIFWSQEAWAVTITRWQVVSMCVGFGFPRDIIYGSLGFFFDLGFDASLLTFDWVISTVLVGRWFIDIDGIVDFNPTFNVQAADISYNSNFCLASFFSDLETELSPAQFELIRETIEQFNFIEWSGQYADLIGHFQSKIGFIPDEVLDADFDLILQKIGIMKILQNYLTSTSQFLCARMLTDLCDMTSINSASYNQWIGECSSLDTSLDSSLDFETIQTYVYEFEYEDSELTFEFIQLRDWLIAIGCPRSLIYRISRVFYFRFDTFSSVAISDYQVNIRYFIFNELRGFVAETDFNDLENALFGPDFGSILQKMWAFRGFRWAGINRAMCAGWFSAWVTLGWTYDITLFTDWDFNKVGWTFPSDFEYNDFIVSPPVFDWTEYFIGWQLSFYNLLASLNAETEIIIALNSLPSNINSIFEVEYYFLKRLEISNDICWNFGQELFSSEAFVPIFREISGNNDAEVNVLLPTERLTLFSPLQMILNNWLDSISWIDDSSRYRIQMAIACYQNTDLQATLDGNFYYYLQNYFKTCGISRELVAQFNAEFSYCMASNYHPILTQCHFRITQILF